MTTQQNGSSTPAEDDGGTAERPAGTVDEDANPPLQDPTEAVVREGTGDLPPQDTGNTVPPYEGRTGAD